MELTMGTRLKRAWNAFTNRDPTRPQWYMANGTTYRPDRPRFTRGNERSIATAIYNRIAMDVAAVTINHCQVDEEDKFKTIIYSSLNECFTLSANLDQTGRAFLQDAAMSLLDEGCIAIIPVEIDDKLDITSLRVGKILEWRPSEIKVKVYNEWTGKKEDLWIPKSRAAIVENPLYAVINEPNSTGQRLKRKLALLDVTDEKAASNKLDIIIQLPYAVKATLRKAQAEERRKDIYEQLSNSQYGVAYTDGTEKITQLNRPVENNLMKQIEYLTNLFFSQLGMTQSILDGTADEQTMLNYFNRTIDPIVFSIVDEVKRKFLTKESRDNHETILVFRDPFKLVPVNQIADIADKFTRNEILSKNEVRQIIGRKPSDDPKADALINSNLNHTPEELASLTNPQSNTEKSLIIDQVLEKTKTI